MRRMVSGVGAALTCAAVLTSGVPVESCGYGGPSPVQRFLQADCVVAGRVIGFEDQNVHALPHPQAPQDVAYRIAVVRVLDALKGATGQDQVRVGLYPTQKLNAGQEVLLFLAEHYEEPFYLMAQQYEYAISAEGNRAFNGQVEQYRRWARLLNNPVAGLKSNDDRDRLDTAVLLVNQLRTYRPQAHRPDQKLAPIDAALSRLILEALAGADWKNGVADFRVSPHRVFAQLGASAKDGWNPQNLRTPQDVEAAARRWLRENAATFRVQGFVEK